MDTQPKQIFHIELIRSLDDAPDPKADAEWATEIEHRILSIDNGSVELETWDAVMNRLRDRRSD